MEKLNFITKEFPAMLEKLPADAKGKWGVMNGQQMAEHMAESVSFATGKNNQELHTKAEDLERFKSFAMSDKEFKENTKNALLPPTPPPVRTPGMEHAIAEYRKEIADFSSYFEKNKGSKLMNSFFGELNYEEWVHLLHKHAVHHAKQFGLM
jgi:hypothetical protein